MNRHPLKMRASKFVKFASIYKETVDVKETLNEAVKVEEEEEEEEEEDFYVITESE